MSPTAQFSIDGAVTVGLDPHWQKGWFRLASALEGLGLLAEAETALDIAMPLEPRLEPQHGTWHPPLPLTAWLLALLLPCLSRQQRVCW